MVHSIFNKKNNICIPLFDLIAYLTEHWVSIKL